METSTPPKPKSFFHQAARASCICTVIIFVLLMVTKQMGMPVVVDLVGLFLMVAGLIFGIVALFGISKHGMKGILFPAVVGIVMNGLLLLIFITNFMAARARALQQQSGAGVAPLVASMETVELTNKILV